MQSSCVSGSSAEKKSLSTSCTSLLRCDSSDLWRCKFPEATAKASAEQSTEMICKFCSSAQRAKGIAALPVPSSAIWHVSSGCPFCHFLICSDVILTSVSVSGRGIKVDLFTSSVSDQNSFSPVKYATGQPASRCCTNFLYAPRSVSSKGWSNLR